MAENFDLLGDPIPEGWGKPGRPQHVATDKNRNKVMMLLALGWNNERIARALSITPPTLRKNYFRELKVREEARDRLDATLASMLWMSASEGNVAAMKEFRKLVERNDLTLGIGERAFQDKRKGKAAKEPKLGKKEEADVAAKSGHEGTGWASLLPN
jgi:hypothetical protein